MKRIYQRFAPWRSAHPGIRPTGRIARSNRCRAIRGAGRGDHVLPESWDRLTLFLREPDAPLDSNIVERALKKAILHRKNSLFYKTAHGAEVGDLFMSLIHTCELNDANPFDYLTELQKHAEDLAKSPPAWMPLNYRQTPPPAERSENPG
jgi:transposase